MEEPTSRRHDTPHAPLRAGRFPDLSAVPRRAKALATARVWTVGWRFTGTRNLAVSLGEWLGM